MREMNRYVFIFVQTKCISGNINTTVKRLLCEHRCIKNESHVYEIIMIHIHNGQQIAQVCRVAPLRDARNLGFCMRLLVHPIAF